MLSENLIIGLAKDAILTVLLTAGPMLGVGLIVGLLVSILQAATQIQEPTMAFIPKILVILGAVILFGPWILRVLVDFTSRVFSALPSFVR